MKSVKDNRGWIKAVIWCDSSVLLNWTAFYPRRADEAASCHSKRTTVTHQLSACIHLHGYSHTSCRHTHTHTQL